MAKKEEVDRDLMKVKPPAGVSTALAAYMENDDSLKEMQGRRVLPRIKIVQNTAGGSLADNFTPGDIVLMPGEAMLAAVEKKSKASDPPFKVVPIFYFEEYCFWSHLDDSDAPAVMNRSHDKKGQIARNAKDKDLRFQKYDWDNENGVLNISDDGKYLGRNVEHLNFASMIYDVDNPLNGEIAVLSFSRGEIGVGTQFISACMLRKIPLWTQVWQFSVAHREKGAARKWWGLDYTSPEDNTILDEHLDKMHEQYLGIKKAHDDKLLVVDHEGNSDDEPTDVSGGQF